VQGPPESVIWFCNFVVEILIPPNAYRDTGKRGKMSSKKILQGEDEDER
jgi:hypothetical protein